ncbi:MAG: hypothetical protein B1H04_02490 [Planctomycetales bacterium 4484_123]|nr:MAG: hypothetical protein B1H04_02490 [Planctomycetales bacterium 4484_123]
MARDSSEFPVVMVRPDLEGLPQYDLPAGFSLRAYRPGDEAEWLRIHELADRYNTFTASTFAEQFGTDAEVLRQRQLYLCDPAGATIGTVTAWFDDEFHGGRWGRVHWVAVVPAFQGRGLGRLLMSAVCNRLRQLGHRRAYLTSNTVRVRAIGLYLKFGFVPEIRNQRDARAWQLLRQRLPDSALAKMDLAWR